MDRSTQQRRVQNYLINKKIQLRLTYKFLALIFFSSALTGYVVYITMFPILSEVLSEAAIARVQTQITIRLVIAGIILALFIVCFTLIITHRLAGPLFNIEDKLDRLIHGEKVGEIQIRDGDELQGLAEKLNILLPRMRRL